MQLAHDEQVHYGHHKNRGTLYSNFRIRGRCCKSKGYTPENSSYDIKLNWKKKLN